MTVAVYTNGGRRSELGRMDRQEHHGLVVASVLHSAGVLSYATPIPPPSPLSVSMADARPTVLLYSDDLFFSVRIQDVVEKLGGQVQSVQSAPALADGLGDVPVLTIVELGPGGQGDWIQAVNYARKWTRSIPIVAFGSHVDVAAREAARAAGCTHVWSKSRFVEELPALVAKYVQPSAETQGCEDAPNDLVRKGLELFNKGEYYHCHDALEEAWFADRRPCRYLYQGILQLAIALHQIENLNYDGADKMFRRAINKFQTLPARCQGLDVDALLHTSRELRQVLIDLGPDRVRDFPHPLFPTIAYPRETPSIPA